jgi:lipopolysaccharide export system permease protein
VHGGALLLALAAIWLRDNGNRFCLRRRVKEAVA